MVRQSVSWSLILIREARFELLNEKFSIVRAVEFSDVRKPLKEFKNCLSIVPCALVHVGCWC